ncbi:MAG: hypothetical protein QW327_01605 [Candidatus Odinarchaeota archaeon]
MVNKLKKYFYNTSKTPLSKIFLEMVKQLKITPHYVSFKRVAPLKQVKLI